MPPVSKRKPPSLPTRRFTARLSPPKDTRTQVLDSEFWFLLFLMKVLHVIDTMDPQAGGPCQGVRNLARRLRAMGHSWEVVCLDEPHESYLANEKIPIHALGRGHTAWSYHPD